MESHTIMTVDDSPMDIWARLEENFERRSEVNAETAQVQLLHFVHKKGEDAKTNIDRFDAAFKYCIDQEVKVGENLSERM